MPSRLSICIFVPDELLAQSLTDFLSGDRYTLDRIASASELINFVEVNKEKIDCLILLNIPSLLPVFNQLYERGMLLPAVLLELEVSKGSQSQPTLPVPEIQANSITTTNSPTYFYHNAEVRLAATKLERIFSAIEQAVAQFLNLEPSCSLSEKPVTTIKSSNENDRESFLLLQQRRLAEKLKERLGYLGVYYKRNSQYFYRNLSQEDKKELLEQLSSQYREIILNYFEQDSEVNSAIDRFVDSAFFADISASQILEIHMELMDEFSQQLKLEGRSEEILLDYRLVLIDILAHLAEMYRRSIPREDIPFELLYRMD
ncbi:MAG: circadian clock protein KaiA [Hydrococcus sp. C42_A2020_068]|nr:circadian clock protein KaiA [Hydrococcus sp. C42_A2020_068]